MAPRCKRGAATSEASLSYANMLSRPRNVKHLISRLANSALTFLVADRLRRRVLYVSCIDGVESTPSPTERGGGRLPVEHRLVGHLPNGDST